jgi:L-amino acid N-acyltransferase YncA
MSKTNNVVKRVPLHVLLTKEEYAMLEEIRKRQGYRTLVETVRYLIKSDFASQVK